VPTGVAANLYKPDASVSEDDSLVVFTGAMDWEPNIDAVEYFCREVWPAILEAVPGARFRIVGRNPDRRVQKLQSASIEVTGRVASVVDHLRKAAVVVVPLRIGGGTRLKIYEAMGTGKAVVSTSVGAEGLDVHNGRDIVLADDSLAFSRAVTTLLKDRQLRGVYGRSALELASKFDWRTVARRFSEVLIAISALKSANEGRASASNV
jgi:polysaccharide biosynthesis protein PslH